MAIEVDSLDEFQTVVKANKFVVVDFWATWCPPCRAIAPEFAKLATEHTAEGTLVFVKVDVDKAGPVVTEYGITSMPTFMFFAAAKPVDVDTLVPRATKAGQKPPPPNQLIGGDSVAYLRAAVGRLAELGKTGSDIEAVSVSGQTPTSQSGTGRADGRDLSLQA